MKNQKKRGGYSLKIKNKRQSSKKIRKSRSRTQSKSKKHFHPILNNNIPSIGVTNRTFLEIFK
jgi:hypothetical protein